MKQFYDRLDRRPNLFDDLPMEGDVRPAAMTIEQQRAIALARARRRREGEAQRPRPTLFDDILPSSRKPNLFDDIPITNPPRPSLYDDIVPQASRLDAIGRSAANAMTFNLADEAVAAGRAGSPYAPFGDRMARGMEMIEQYVPDWLLGSADARARAKTGLRAQQQDFDRFHAQEQAGSDRAHQAYPYTSTAAGVAGGVATGLGAASRGLTLMNMGRPTVGGMAARGAAEGALYGGAYGFGSGDGLGDRLGRAVTGAAISAPLGGVLGGGVGALAQRLVSQSIPTTDALTAKAHQMYDAAKRSGIDIKPNAFQSAASSIRQTVKREGYHPRIHPKVSAPLEELDLAASGPVDFQYLDQIRRVAGAAARSIEPDEQRLAAMVIDKIDDFVDGLSSQHIVGGADPRAAVGFLKEARSLWSRRSKADIIETAIERAQTRAAQYSNSGLDNALQTEFRQIVMNPKRLRRFSPTEQDAIKQVARSGPIEGLVRLLGKFAPRGNISTVLSGGTGYVLGGGPGAALMLGAGEVGKRTATAMRSHHARLAAELMRAGGKRPAAKPLSAANRQLIDALIAGQAAGLN